MFDYIPNDNYKSEIVYYHGASSDASSEGMTNKSSACWMISVMQALRSSPLFREQFAPKKEEKSEIKNDLFRFFDIVEGKNGQKRRSLKPQEVRDYQLLLIKNGLPAKVDHGYHSDAFLRFLLEKIGAKNIEYRTTNARKKKREMLLSLSISDQTLLRTLQSIVDQAKIIFTTDAPKFLPISLKRQRVKDIGACRAPIEPSETIQINNARYKLVAIIIARDSSKHAYSYIPEFNAKKKPVWVEYNDLKVHVYKSPKKDIRKGGISTPYEDACKHSRILIYEAI